MLNRKVCVLGLVMILMCTVYMAGCTSPFGPQYPPGGCSYQGVEADPSSYEIIEKQTHDGGWVSYQYNLNITLGPMDLAHKDALLRTKIYLNITHNNVVSMVWRFNAEETNFTSDGGLNVTFRPEPVTNPQGSSSSYKYIRGISSPFSLKYWVVSDDAFIVNNTFSQGNALYNGHIIMSKNGVDVQNMSLDHSYAGVTVKNLYSGSQWDVNVRNGWLRTMVRFTSSERCMG